MSKTAGDWSLLYKGAISRAEAAEKELLIHRKAASLDVNLTESVEHLQVLDDYKKERDEAVARERKLREHVLLAWRHLTAEPERYEDAMDELRPCLPRKRAALKSTDKEGKP